MHLLIPQVEHSVRVLLANAGATTSRLTSDDSQNDYNLNQTLVDDLFTEPLTHIVGEDVLFDLRCLLIEHGSSNLRNRMAHGRVDDGEWNSAPCVYLWWLVLRLCCLPLLIAAASSQPPVVDEELHAIPKVEGSGGANPVAPERGRQASTIEEDVEPCRWCSAYSSDSAPTRIAPSRLALNSV